LSLEYSKCSLVARMQSWRCLCQWSMALSILLCCTPAHTSVRRCIKSFTSCTFCLVDSLLNYTAGFLVSWVDVRAVQQPINWNYTTHCGDHYLWDYCTFRVEAQGSLATHLRCAGIFIGHFVTLSLLSQLVKEFWKLVKIWQSYGQE